MSLTIITSGGLSAVNISYLFNFISSLIDKGSKINILIQFILWTIAFGLISFVLIKFNLVN